MKSLASRQLSLVFADSPRGFEETPSPSALTGRSFLKHIARTRKANETSTSTAAATRPMDEVASLPNLARALLRVARNKGAHGVDGRSVEAVVGESHRLIPKLRHELLTGRYRPGDVRRVWIPKPGGGQRGLGIPNVVDRLVQQAVHQVLEPISETGFHDSSHGFRKGRGAQTAIAEASVYVEEGYDWVVAIDLSKFFDRVNHQRLLARVSQKVQDRRILSLIHLMLKAAVVMPDGTKVQTTEGTPQGGPLSPLLSNIVLDELDWELERRGLRFVRYADDFNVFVRSERAATRVMSSLTLFLEGRLRLKTNLDKSEVARPEQVHLLGFSLRKRDEPEGGVEVLLSKRTRQRMDAKVRALTPRNWGRSLEECMDGVSRYVRGWTAYFRLCTPEHANYFFKRYDAHIRRRIRAIIIKQKKRGRHLYRHLVERGAGKKGASLSAYNGGIWTRSHTAGINRAYNNAWFHGRMASLWRCWKDLNPFACTTEVSHGQLKLPGLEIES